MADETKSDIDNEKTAVSVEEDNNHSLNQPLENGNHQDDSSNNQLTENHPTKTEFIEQISQNNLQPSSPTHNQQDEGEVEGDQLNITDNQNESNSNDNQDQSNITDNQDQSNLLSVDNDESNIDNNFETETNLHDKPDELKPQREIDEDEIPPAKIEIDETTNSLSESSSDIITDDRPLTELETPYKHHHEDETSINTEDQISYEKKASDIKLSSFLPDVVNETFEQNHEDQNSQTTELEKPLNQENLVQNEVHFTQEDFPPLPPTLAPVEQIFNKEEDFPPLSASSISVEQTFNKEEEKSNTDSIPFKSEDILGNKTLIKQTIVKGISDTRPTRSTLVTISYTLTLVDNITSNARVIENVSNENYFVSECDLIPAIDICVLSMDRGERAIIDSDIRHCYGENGCEEKQIPPITTLNSYRMKIDLELHDWISPPDVQILSIEDRLYWGDKKRQMGNFYYRRQDYKTSLQCYLGALRFLSTEDNPILISFDQSQQSILIDRFIQVQNNVAQVNLLLNRYQACLNAVENVLKYDPKNVKALFRQGKALFELGKYEQAIQSLKLFTQIQKGNPNMGLDNDKANEMLSISENKLANYQKAEKEIYRRMFQPTTTTNSALNQQRKTTNTNETDNANTNLWPYIALGTAALAAVSLVIFIKYRKTA